MKRKPSLRVVKVIDHDGTHYEVQKRFWWWWVVLADGQRWQFTQEEADMVFDKEYDKMISKKIKKYIKSRTEVITDDIKKGYEDAY